LQQAILWGFAAVVRLFFWLFFSVRRRGAAPFGDECLLAQEESSQEDTSPQLHSHCRNHSCCSVAGLVMEEEEQQEEEQQWL